MKKYLLIFLTLASANLFAEVNKWVDSNDRVHYSDQPPPANAKTASPAKPKTPRPGSAEGENKNDIAPASAVAAPKTIMEREAELKKAQKAKQEAADKAAVKQANEEVMKSNCANAQQTLKTLQSGGRIAEVDASGERSFLGDEQLQQRIAKAQQAVSTYCK